MAKRLHLIELLSLLLATTPAVVSFLLPTATVRGKKYEECPSWLAAHKGPDDIFSEMTPSIVDAEIVESSRDADFGSTTELSYHLPDLPASEVEKIEEARQKLGATTEKLSEQLSEHFHL